MFVILTTVLNVLVVSVAFVLGVGYLLPTIFNRLFSPIGHVPGPFWARFSRAWELWRVMKGGAHYEYMQWHKKYGP